jgi:thiol-disulfide isomerase/thioredoxin
MPSARGPLTVSGAAGKPAPPFAGKTPEGKDIQLADYSGKLVLLNFWATWCGPCRQEMPELIELQKKYESQGFTIIGMANENDTEKVREFVAANGLNYPQVMATNEMMNQYGARALPTSILIGKDGTILEYTQGVPSDGSIGEFWEKRIKESL